MTDDRENEIPLISWRRWVVISLISLGAGGFLHWAVTAGVYLLASANIVKAQANFARNWGVITDGRDYTGKPLQKSVPAAEFMLRYMGLPADSIDGDLLNRLNGAYQLSGANASDKPAEDGESHLLEATPALLVAARLLGPGRSSECEKQIINNVGNALGRQLLGWPGNTEFELNSIKQFRQARADNTNGAARLDAAASAAVTPAGASAAAPTAAAPTAIAPTATAPTATAPTAAAPTLAPAIAARTTPLMGKSADAESRIKEACEKFRDASVPGIKFFGPTFSRTEPKSADDLAEVILGADACLPGGAASKDFTECRLVKALFSGTLNEDSVRSSRLKINFFWGWERAAVAVLAFLVLLAMRYLRQMRKPLERQEKWLQEWLAEADRRLSPNKPALSTVSPEAEAKNMHQQFHIKFGCSDSQAAPFKWNGGLTVLRDLVDAAQESLQTQHRAHLEKFVELHTQALARQRAFINALITAFPAIGLVATLHGLIVALSRASGIVAGTEAERFSSTELVTGVLSSSFATTMLALIAMAICMLINVREEHREADLLESTHKRLIAVFWPGRPTSATASQVASPLSKL